MPARTDFNVSPYWDTFAQTNDFYRVLFRPGFAVQARELTTLQTILQNQIEQFGNHFFKEGTIVIPGRVAYDDKYYAIKLQATYGSPTPVAISTYLEQYAAGTHNSIEYTTGAVLTGVTSGVTAEVVGYAVNTTGGDPDTLFVKYISSNTSDNTTTTFSNDEEIKADRPISSYSSGTASAQLQVTAATVTGSSASVTEGIFYVRGFMTRTTAQTVVLDKYTNTPSYRIGFNITETLVTPEDDSNLLDNAQGSSNYAAKGAHRFKMQLTLAKIGLETTTDENFIELARVVNGVVVSRKNATEYSVVADMLARRTADESGNYIVRHFDIEARENLNNGTNRGIYTAAEGGVETKDTLVIAPGKAYVNGYEIETQTSSFLNFNKARSTKNVQNDTIPFNLGNYAQVDAVYSQPDVSLVGSSIDPFDSLKLYDQQIVTGGSSNGEWIGLARSRAFEYKSGTVGAASAIYHNYLFDITMFTKLVLSANATTLTAKSVVTGASSGATGIVVATVSSAADVFLMQVVGSFQAGESLTSSSSTDDSGSGTINTITSYDFGKHVKSLYQDTTPIDYTSNVLLDQNLTLSGEITTTAAGTTITGTNTKFTTELLVNDLIQLPTGAAGATETFRVNSITNNLALVVAQTGSGSNPANTTTAVSSAKGTRIRGKLQEEEETVLVYKTPKDNTKTLLSGGVSDTSYTFRKQFIGTTNASSAVSFTANAGESFFSASAGRDYTLTVTATGSGSLGNGGILDVSSTKPITTTVTGTGTQTLTITDATLLGTSAAVTLMATITVGVKAQKTKTANKMTKMIVDSSKAAGGSKDVYGARVDDATISLQYADTYGLHAVYESSAIGTAPVTPTLTIANSTGTFTIGEVITGSNSSATGRVIINSPSTTIQYVVLTGTFTTNDTISGGTSGYQADVSATTPGDRQILSNFLLDTGQRDSYYDLGRAVRKPDAVTPTGELMFIYDYFTHGTGDYFSVDSYTGQIDYVDIPQYQSTKVDPQSKAPVGLYELRDSLDFRPAVQAQTSPTSNPFAFDNKNFEGSGASAGNMVRPDDNVTLDFDFYLGRLDLLYLDPLGNFITVAGISAEEPTYPAIENINMLIARVEVGPYTYKPETDVTIHYEFNRRYTMRDIGKLEGRIGKLEYATALGLLERETDSFQVLDADGLDRFKSGFLVDNFYGHNFGNTLLLDYSCAVDPGRGHMRPKSNQRIIGLEEENSTDSARSSSYYQKTGDIVTLPYTHTAEVTQPYASRAESVNPFSVTLWAGNMILTPDNDFWMDERRVPSITIDVEGNYQQMLREVGGNTDLGTIWDSWNTTWTGNERTSSWDWLANRGGNWRQNMRTTVTSVDARQRRTGTNTRLVERIDQVSTGDRVLSIDVIPWIRERDVNFTVTGMKPNTRVYAFFDRVDVNAQVKPTGGSASNTTLNGALTKTATTVTVASTTGFPTTGTIGVGDTTVTDSFGQTFRQQEQMTYTGTTATTFTGITRNTGNQFIEPQEWATGQAVTNQTYGTQMVTDGIGTLYGRFKIPNTDTKRFRVGTRTFRLTDSSVNSMVPGIVETAVERPYTAQGFIQTKREEIMNVRNAGMADTTVTENRQVVQTVDRRDTAQSGVWYDPLAQSIMCDKTTGMYITKVDVFFQAKDDTLPVWVEVRTMVNGYPSSVVMPFSKVSLTPSDITVSATAATATTFTFDSPIYIQHQQEFCVVVASNSPKYKIWISRLGDTEIGGTRTISTQPYLGSLFKSQNASTWTPSQFEDMKFTLYRAEFDIANTGALALVNEELKADSDLIIPARLGGGKESGIATLDPDPIDTSSKVISTTITNGGSGYTSVPTVAFSAPTSGVTATGVAVISGAAVTSITLTNPGDGYTTAPTISFSGGGGSAAAATATTASTSVRVRFKDHAMYSTSNNVTISGVTSEVSPSALNGAITSGQTGTVNVDDSSNWPTAGYVKIDNELIAYSSKPNTTSISVSTRGYNSTTAAAHEDNSIVELYMIGCSAATGIPLTEINKTHTALTSVPELDAFQITTTTPAASTVSSGGSGVQCTKNISMDVMQPVIQMMELPSTTITGKLQTTTGTSVNGTQTSFSRTAAANAKDIPIDQDYYFDAPQIVCSKINETNELSGNKSLRIMANMTSNNSAVSPSIDLRRMGVICISNKTNKVDSSSDIASLSNYNPMTIPEGDPNKGIYMTKKVALTQGATAIQVLFDAVVMSESNIKVLYKTLRTDSSENFDDIEWQFFNTDGSPDSSVPLSKTRFDFKEYSYFAGMNSSGVGTELPEYIALAIKVVFQTSNSSLPPMIKDFRTIAFQA